MRPGRSWRIWRARGCDGLPLPRSRGTVSAFGPMAQSHRPAPAGRALASRALAVPVLRRRLHGGRGKAVLFLIRPLPPKS